MTDTAIILDLDGTLLHGSEPIGGAVDAANSWVELGFRLGYATNDAVLTLAEQRERLRGAGFPMRDAVGDIPIVTAATVTAGRLNARSQSVRTQVMLVGADAVRETLEASIGVVRAGDWPGLTQGAGPEVDVVVVGLDRRMTYESLSAAVAAVDRGAELLATNADASYRDEHGVTRPGAGAMVAAIECATGRPATLIGKPAPALLQAVLVAQDSSPNDEVVVVGDTESDMRAGQAIGARCLRVASDVEGLRSWPAIGELLGIKLLDRLRLPAEGVR